MVYYHKVLRDCKIFLIYLDMLLYSDSETEIFIYQKNLGNSNDFNKRVSHILYLIINH